jgi:putative transposase
MFMETFGEACRKTGWLVDAWILMSNHYHLVLRTPQANLVAGMRWLTKYLHSPLQCSKSAWGSRLLTDPFCQSFVGSGVS